MKIIDVIILIEHINRELESAIILKQELVGRGYSVKIISTFWDFGDAIVKYRPKLVITPWAYDDWEVDLLTSFYGGMKDGKFFLLNLHHEQMTYADAQDFMIPRGKAKDCYHIAWGNYYREMLLKDGVKDSMIAVTGSSRLDLFAPTFLGLSMTKKELAEKYNLNLSQKWILILGNFSFAYFTEEKIKQQFERGNKAAYELAAESKYMLSHITGWITQLCQHYSDIEVIYRPHPSEEIYPAHIKLMDKFKNFHVNKEKSVRDWIVNIDAAYMWNSTSAVEVAFANKPIFALRPKPVSDSLTIEMLDTIPTVCNYMEFSDSVASVIEGTHKECDSQFKEGLKYYYAQSDRTAVDKIADFVDLIFATNAGEISPRLKRFSFERYKIYFKQIMKNMIRSMGLIRFSKKYTLQKNDYFNDNMIATIEKKLDRKLNYED